MPKKIIEIIDNKKQCSTCKEWKILNMFRKNKLYQTGYCSQCKKCEYSTTKIRISKYRKHKKPKHKKTIQFKNEVLKIYGNKCVCCSESNMKLLTIDHVNNNGREHGNEQRRYKGIDLYKFVIRSGFVDGLQIMCFNCNIGKYNNKGICPHKE